MVGLGTESETSTRKTTASLSPPRVISAPAKARIRHRVSSSRRVSEKISRRREGPGAGQPIQARIGNRMRRRRARGDVKIKSGGPHPGLPYRARVPPKSEERISGEGADSDDGTFAIRS